MAGPTPDYSPDAQRVAVVIPSYRVADTVLELIAQIGPEIGAIYLVDDDCPDSTADIVDRECNDPRLVVLRRDANGGVGAATLDGMRRAFADGFNIAVKLDGDGQVDPRLIPRLIRPIISGEADFSKGNRFYDLATLSEMPFGRRLGNAGLSFLTKLSSGYWKIFDPTNGFIAIGSLVFRDLPLDKIARRYFFESDLLFRLNLIRAVVVDVPMHARYPARSGGLKPIREMPRFAWLNLRNFAKRVVYNYFIRDFSVPTLFLLFGLPLLLFGMSFGSWVWAASAASGGNTPVGTVMLAALPIILGFQLLLSFLTHDLQSTPTVPISRRLSEELFD